MSKQTKPEAPQPTEAEVLRRMLSAPPKPHAPKPAKKTAKKPTK